MPRPTLNLTITIENVHCFDEGDGWGNAEPYLWPIFFKIDGDSYAVEPGAGLIGFPTISSRSGGHGNLNNTDVDAGDDVPVPESLGLWETKLKPIPINDPVLKAALGDLPGICGCGVVLMEQDDWPDGLATTGYDTFVNAVTSAVAKVANSFQHATSAPTPAEIDAQIQAVKDQAAQAVHDAVKGAMSGWQLIWYGTVGNNDDVVGSQFWTKTHDDFKTDAFIDFSQRWSGKNSGDGDWQVGGIFSGVEPCPADALAGLLDAFGGKPQNRTHDWLGTMRDFRGTRLAHYPGLDRWWNAFQQSAPAVLRTAFREPEARHAIARLAAALPEAAGAPDRPLDSAHLADLKTVLSLVSRHSARTEQRFARRALQFLPQLEQQSFDVALRRLARVPPSGRGRCRTGDPKTKT